MLESTKRVFSVGVFICRGMQDNKIPHVDSVFPNHSTRLARYSYIGRASLSFSRGGLSHVQ